MNDQASDPEFVRLLTEAARRQMEADRAYMRALRVKPKAMTQSEFARRYAAEMQERRVSRQDAAGGAG